MPLQTTLTSVSLIFAALTVALFITSVVPSINFEWVKGRSGMIVEDCNDPAFCSLQSKYQNRFQVLQNPFYVTMLYNAGTLQVGSFVGWDQLQPMCKDNSSEIFLKFAKPNNLCGPDGSYNVPATVSMVQSVIVVVIMFLFAALASVCLNLCTSSNVVVGIMAVLLTTSFALAIVVQSRWANFNVTKYFQNNPDAVVPFWNATVYYAGQQSIQKKRSTGYEGTFYVDASVPSAFMAIAFDGFSYGAGWSSLTAGTCFLGISAALALGAALVACLDSRGKSDSYGSGVFRGDQTSGRVLGGPIGTTIIQNEEVPVAQAYPTATANSSTAQPTASYWAPEAVALKQT